MTDMKSSTALHNVELPPTLVVFAESKLKVTNLLLTHSDIALCLSMRLERPVPTESKEAFREHVSTLVAALRSAAALADTPWPLILLIDIGPLSSVQEQDQEDTRAFLTRLSHDPTWHKGDCCLYVLPLNLADSPAEDGQPRVKWQGPSSIERMRSLLLDREVIQDLPKIQTLNIQGLLAFVKKKRSPDQPVNQEIELVCERLMHVQDRPKESQAVETVKTWVDEQVRRRASTAGGQR